MNQVKVRNGEQGGGAEAEEMTVKEIFNNI